MKTARVALVTRTTDPSEGIGRREAPELEGN